MPANEFEKQVQKQLDDFRLNPSASVWKKVEEQIRDKKRRRVILFILLPALLILTGFSIYYFINAGEKPGLTEQPLAVKNEISSTGDKSLSEKKEQTDSSSLNETTKTERSTTGTFSKQKNIKEGNDRSEVISTNAPVSHIKIKQPVKKTETREIAENKKGLSPVISNKAEDKQELAVSADKPATGIISKNKTKEDPVTETGTGVTHLLGADHNDSLIVSQKDPGPTKTDSVKTEAFVKTDNKKQPKEKKASKIKWGFDLSAGISSNQSKVFSLLKSSNDVAYFAAGPVSSPGAPTTIPPSPVKAGAAFRIGLTGEWKLSGRNSLSLGLQYNYASNRIKVGLGIDTALRVQSNNNYSQVDIVYRGNHKNNYTNSYHFLSLPIAYHWLISKRFPLQWNVGVSFNYLFATNALVYNPSYGGIYYRDKEAFNKMHVNIGTGLSFRFTGKNGMVWKIGPELSFDTRKLVNDGGERQYLLFTGIDAKLFFPKKKNK